MKGLRLGLSMTGGIFIGPELVVSGDGTSTTGWVAWGGVLTAVGGRLRQTCNSAAVNPTHQQNIATVAGKTYRVQATGYPATSNPRVNVGTSTLGGELVASSNINGPFQAFFVAPGASVSLNIFSTSTVLNDYAEYDDISIKQYGS